MGTKSKKYQPPKPNKGDTGHLVARGIFSIVPGASELFEYFITPPLEKKLEVWREQVGETLRQLEISKGIDLRVLQSNERFISIVMQATTIAMRNYQEEKLSALRNAILNSAQVSNMKEDLQLVFIRFIDELTPSHITLLSFFVKNETSIARMKSYYHLFEWFEKFYPNLLSREVFRLVCGDLVTRGLIRISQDIEDFEDIYQASAILAEETKDDLPRIIVTEIAEEFLKYISKDG